MRTLFVALVCFVLCLVFTGCEPDKGCKCYQSTWHNCACIRCNCRSHYRCSEKCKCELEGYLTPEQRSKEIDRLGREVKQLEKMSQ